MFPAISSASKYRVVEAHKRQRKNGTSDTAALPKFPRIQRSKARKAQGSEYHRTYSRTLRYTLLSVDSDTSLDDGVEDVTSPVGHTTNFLPPIEVQRTITHREKYDRFLEKKQGRGLDNRMLDLPTKTAAYLRRRALLRRHRTPPIIKPPLRTNQQLPSLRTNQGYIPFDETSRDPDEVELWLQSSENVNNTTEEFRVKRSPNLKESVGSPQPKTSETKENDEPDVDDELEDSDDELMHPIKRSVPERRTNPVEIYEAACRLKKITPVQKFLKQLGQRKIELRNHLLGPTDIRGIAIALSSQQKVTDFDISGNNFGPQGTRYLAQFIQSNSRINILVMSSTFPDVEGCRSLSDALKDNTSIRILKLGENAIGEQHILHLANYIRVTRTLRELYLNHNRLDEMGGRILGSALAQNKSIQVLDLTWNHLRRIGAEAICKALAVNSTLEKLNISWNGFSKEGCKCLAKVLPKNDTLRHLNISSNRINMKGLLFLLKGLIRNEGITSLKIGNNPLTTEGAITIVEALIFSERCRLEELDLSDVPVDDKFLKAMERLQEKRIISIHHGPLYRQDESKAGQVSNSMGIERFDPLLVLYEYMKADSLRLVDMFHYFDTDHNGYISTAELRDGFVNSNIPLTEHGLETLMKTMDIDKDGQIDLQEMMAGHRKFNKIVAERNRIARLRRKPEDASLKELRGIIKKMLTERNEKLKETKGDKDARTLSLKTTDKLVPGVSQSRRASRRASRRSRVSLVQ